MTAKGRQDPLGTDLHSGLTVLAPCALWHIGYLITMRELKRRLGTTLKRAIGTEVLANV